VAYSDMMSIQSFMKIHPLVQNLSRGQHKDIMIPKAHTYQYSGILIMGVRLTSHWTAAAFTGLLSVPGWEWMSEWVKWMSERTILFSFSEMWSPRWNYIDRGKPKDSEKNLSQCHFVHHKSHWIDPGRRRERPATNRLSHGTASLSVQYRTQFDDLMLAWVLFKWERTSQETFK
jgi:hypothetical protein